MKTIRNLTVGGLITGMCFIGANGVMAGEQEWATAGKVLTGVVLAGAIHQATHHGGHVSVVFGSPPPRPVIVPAPVVVRPPRPVFVPCAPPPPRVVVVERPAYRPRPIIVQRVDRGAYYKPKFKSKKVSHGRYQHPRSNRGYHGRR